ncbi:hypothetical protein PRIPAC_79501 [Pristionchus pacificus]|uniref:ShK domain-containing protein n=1 Tax=Pristionchus pacificus TaxID=54126 RepID=A0A2A6C4K3_PRIPA|nr:hypothetical protein PRIPAC_79501 [Pristionchus pacificus]|eukprot:PDM73094.1 ShK domain-containing protein [Pristionchus pacificus]
MISNLLFASLAIVGIVFKQTCTDLINVSTGVSDCSAQITFCNNPVFYDTMTTQCPKTCGRCAADNNNNNNSGTNTGATTTCVDLSNPLTGVSDCQSSAYLCDNLVYYSFMTEQCPKTCNRCPGARRK